MTEYLYATGRRKTAVARVRLYDKKGTVLVNDKPFQEVFPRLDHRNLVILPLKVAEATDRFSVTVKVEGGGVTGQAQAVAHGIARALVKSNEALRPLLRQAGLLTRDPRIKERKKYGLKRARKAKQYTKR